MCSPRDHVAILTQCEQVSDPAVRRLYRLGTRFDWFKNYLRVFRAEF